MQRFLRHLRHRAYMRFDQTASDILTFKDQINTIIIGLPLLQYTNWDVEIRALSSATSGSNQKAPNHSLPHSTEFTLSVAEWAQGRL